PPFEDPKKVNAAIKDYSKMLLADGIVQNFYQKLGTAGMADVQNMMGGLPVRNFSAGQLADVKAGEKFKMGADYIAPMNIELGGMLGVLMEAGLGVFGDVKFMTDCLAEIRRGSEQGRRWAQGTARVGEQYQVRRVPVIKKQAISAYDPRVVEATGISMMTTAQGADHTTGNLPRLNTREMDTETLLKQSLGAQTMCAATDSLGLCIFGRSVTEPNTQFIVDALNAACGTTYTKDFF